MNVLAIDYGEKEIGFAFKTSDADVAVPFGEVGAQGLIEKIKSIIKEEGIGVVVVGMPWAVSGMETDQTRKTQKFVQELGDAIKAGDLKTKVEITNEALSSVEAAENELYDNVSIHERSAMVVLEDWMEQNKAEQNNLEQNKNVS